MNSKDWKIIRELAKKVAEVAAEPEQEEKRQVWYAHNSLRPIRPPTYCSIEGAWVELLAENALACDDQECRQIESDLRRRLYAAEHFRDDQICGNVFHVYRSLKTTDWGVWPQYIHSDCARGAYRWDPPIKTREDLEKIQTPTVTEDVEATQAELERYQDLLADIMEVRLAGIGWWSSAGLIDEWTLLRGIDQTFGDMGEDPEMVHVGMGRLMEGRLAYLESAEAQGLLSLNNGNDVVGSGGLGFTHELPGPEYDGHPKAANLWGFAEAQTMSLVSPAMHGEFVLRYQVPILARFGLNCYGCCEPLHLKLDLIKRHVPRLRRVSISPWADKRMSAEKLGSSIIYSWKPNPAYVAGVNFDPELIRKDIRETVEITREYGCILEIILTGTETCNHQPWRFDEWTRIAREEVERAAA